MRLKLDEVLLTFRNCTIFADTKLNEWTIKSVQIHTLL